MKSIEAKREVIWTGIVLKEAFSLSAEIVDPSHVRFVLDKNIDEGIVNTLSGIAKGAVGFAKAHPVLTGAMALYAVDAIKKYKKNKQYVTQLYASNAQEKKFYKKLVDDLMRTGHYHKVKEQFVDGGYLWELRRK